MASYPPSNPLPKGKGSMSSYAVVITDMWDKHWCDAATDRVAELACHINKFVTEARERGALIIHAPSDTMGFYDKLPEHDKAHPEREKWRKARLRALHNLTPTQPARGSRRRFFANEPNERKQGR